MSSDHVRTTVAGWASVLAGGAHLAAASGHHDAARWHTTALTAAGAVQVAVGAGLLQRPASRVLPRIAVGVGLGTTAAYAAEISRGGHSPSILGAVTIVAALAIAVSVGGRNRSPGRRPAVLTAVLVTLLVATGLGPSVVSAATTDHASDNTPGGCSSPNRRMTLYAEQLPPTAAGQVRLGWGLSPSTASIPGPLIEMTEGDCLAITVVNDIPEATLRALRRPGSTTPIGVSLHVHGVKYRQASDGTEQHHSFVPPGGSRTFIWYAQPRVVAAGRVTSNGTAGTWWYHDHVIGTTHGTAGVEAGLAGGLVVRRAGDPKPDRTYTVVMGQDATLNYRRSGDFCPGGVGAPSNTCIKATEGERVEFVVFNVGDAMHTFHLHGHNWADNRTGIPDLAADSQLVDARIIGPSESFGFQVVAGESVGPGAWMLHCHVQSHSDAGMTTDFHVAPKTASPTDPAVDELPVHSH